MSDESTDEQGEMRPIRILLHSDVRVWSQAGDDLCPKARKAQALLAILSLSSDGPIPRQRVAKLLWSASEPSVRLARLRDLVHGLKLSMGQFEADILDISPNKIGFRPRRVHLELGLVDEPSTSNNTPSRFLIDLEGVDPALDQWLTSLRLERHRIASGFGTQDVSATRSSTFDPDQCSLAITDIATTSPDDADLASSLLGQISYILTRFRWFRTITRDTRGQFLRVGDQDFSTLADYALVGTLRSTGDAHELYVELIASGHDRQVVWAAPYELEWQAGRMPQKDLAERIAARIDTELLLAEVTRHQLGTPANEQNAYHLVLRAIPAIYQLEREKFLGVGHLLEQAVEANPDSAFAHSWLAYWYIFLVGQGWAHNPVQVMAKAGRAADRAMVLDPRDARGFTVGGHVRAYIGKRLDEAAALHDIALQLNPSLPLAWHLAGMTSAYAGRLDEAQLRVSRCQSLAYANPIIFFSEGALAIVHLLKHEHERSAEIGRRVTQRHPNFTSAYKSTISALGHLGEKTAAQRLTQKLKQLEPQFTLRSFQATAPYRRREDLAHFVTGLRLAGVT